ncbi:MAG: hypothetical protein BECKG1743E_GA0114224_113041 [Candidatus Kentron sp. G]|nr:MAG: hypothetical protein BECKG1743E_GA0114224_113041 [Candidatus Kentron sp. G]
MRIYLDSCSLQRPLDDQTQLRIRVETEAVVSILAAAQAGDVILLNSEALEYETGRIPDEQRRTEVAAVLASANEYPSTAAPKFGYHLCDTAAPLRRHWVIC